MIRAYKASLINDLYDLSVKGNISIEELADDISEDCIEFYQQGRADEHKNTEMFREIFLENLINQSVDREEAFMYRNICEMSWSKYLEQLKENKNEQI